LHPPKTKRSDPIIIVPASALPFGALEGGLIPSNITSHLPSVTVYYNIDDTYP